MTTYVLAFFFSSFLSAKGAYQPFRINPFTKTDSCNQEVNKACAPLYNWQGVIGCAWLKREVFSKECAHYVDIIFDLHLTYIAIPRECQPTDIYPCFEKHLADRIICLKRLSYHTPYCQKLGDKLIKGYTELYKLNGVSL